MLIVALALAVIGLAALVTAVVTSNEIVAWVCIAASALGVILLVVDAVRERAARRAGVLSGTAAGEAETTEVIDGVGDTESIGAAGDTEIIEAIEDVESDADLDAAVDLDADADADTELEAEIAVEDHPEELIHDEPEYDTYSDDEPEYPQPAEESALHTVGDDEADQADEAAVDTDKPDER